MYKIISLLVLLFLLPSLAWGQSLGNAARKERERRETNKKQGIEAREFSEEEIFGGVEENPEGEDLAEGAGEAADREQQNPPPLRDNIDLRLRESLRRLEDDREED